jgi:hypothetical protein
MRYSPLVVACVVFSSITCADRAAPDHPPSRSSEWILVNVLAERQGTSGEFEEADVGDQMLIRVSNIIEVRMYGSEFAHLTVASPMPARIPPRQLVVAAPIELFVEVLDPLIPLGG